MFHVLQKKPLPVISDQEGEKDIIELHLGLYRADKTAEYAAIVEGVEKAINADVLRTVQSGSLSPK